MLRVLVPLLLIAPLTAHADELCYAAVGAPDPSPPANKKPPSAYKASACAKLPTFDDKLPKQPLLGGRLLLPFPASADTHVPMAHDVMGALPSEATRTRLGYHLGARGFVVIAEEFAQSAPGPQKLTCHFSNGDPLQIGSTDQAIKDFGKAMFESEPVSLPRQPDGLRVTAFVPKGESAHDGADNHMLVGAMVELPDGTLARIDIGVGPEVDAKPCAAAALELLSRLTVGTPIDLGGGERKLGRYAVTLPPRNVVSYNRGPDFDEYRIKRYGPLAAFSGFAQVTLERTADAPKIQGDVKLPGKLFGKDVTFLGQDRGRGRTVGVVVPAPNQDGHSVRVELVATRDPAYIGELLKIAATLKLAP